jgi:hypothetical protein
MLLPLRSVRFRLHQKPPKWVVILLETLDVETCRFVIYRLSRNPSCFSIANSFSRALVPIVISPVLAFLQIEMPFGGFARLTI